MNPDFYERLDARVRELEHGVRGMRAELDSARRAFDAPPVAPPRSAAASLAAPPPAIEPGPPLDERFWQPPPAAAGPVPAPAVARQPRGSLESLLAGRGLLLAGMLCVLLGTGYFLNYAIKAGWIGPLEQVLLALAVGAALIVFAATRIGRDLTFLAEGLIALGAGIDFLGLWASVAVYPELHVPRAAAFAGMVAVTAVLAVLALRRGSERLALLGMIGGYVAPALLDVAWPDRPLVAAYLLVLTATMLALAVRASFRWVEALAFAAVACYTPVFLGDRSSRWTDAQAATVATIFYAVFAAAYTLAAVADRKVSGIRLLLLVLNAAGYAFVLETTFADHAATAGWTLLAAGAASIVISRARVLPPRLATTQLYLGLALATLALPSLLHEASLLDVFIVEAALLVLIGTRGADRWLLAAGSALFAVTGVVLLERAASDPPQHDPVGSLALSFAISVAALAFALARLRAARGAVPAERGLRIAAIVALNVIALTGLSRECVDVLGGPRGLDALSSRGEFGLSAVWALYATGLFGVGMARADGLLRWLGLGLFGCTIVKVFLIDLASLEVAYRIVSFVGLGVILVGVSAWYQRTMARQNAAHPES